MSGHVHDLKPCRENVTKFYATMSVASSKPHSCCTLHSEAPENAAAGPAQNTGEQKIAEDGGAGGAPQAECNECLPTQCHCGAGNPRRPKLEATGHQRSPNPSAEGVGEYSLQGLNCIHCKTTCDVVFMYRRWYPFRCLSMRDKIVRRSHEERGETKSSGDHMKRENEI